MAGLDRERISFILRSDLRGKVLSVLLKGESTPARISEKLGVHIDQVQRALRWLEPAHLAVCITPHRRRGKVYCLTEKGYVAMERAKRARTGRRKK